MIIHHPSIPEWLSYTLRITLQELMLLGSKGIPKQIIQFYITHKYEPNTKLTEYTFVCFKKYIFHRELFFSINILKLFYNNCYKHVLVKRSNKKVMQCNLDLIIALYFLTYISFTYYNCFKRIHIHFF